MHTSERVSACQRVKHQQVEIDKKKFRPSCGSPLPLLTLVCFGAPNTTTSISGDWDCCARFISPQQWFLLPACVVSAAVSENESTHQKTRRNLAALLKFAQPAAHVPSFVSCGLWPTGLAAIPYQGMSDKVVGIKATFSVRGQAVHQFSSSGATDSSPPAAAASGIGEQVTPPSFCARGCSVCMYARTHDLMIHIVRELTTNTAAVAWNTRG